MMTTKPFIPKNGMWLYNESHKVISDKVYLGKEADANEWIEITQEQKEFLESLWASETEDFSEANIPQETLIKAQAYDVITGGIE